MSVLDSVLQYKARKEAIQAQQEQAIPQAVQAFIRARQQATENQQKNMLMQIQAANAGYSIQNGQLTLDTQSPKFQSSILDSQLKQAKLASESGKSRVYDAMLNGGSSGIDDGQSKLAESMRQSGFSKEDYILKPITRMVAGVPHTANVPELKPPVPASARKIIDEINPVRLGLDQNLDYLAKNPAIEKYMTPGDIRAHKGGSPTGFLGNVLLKIDPSKDGQAFGVFKAETDKIFQKFRKETTGAQAAMAELGWLAPDFPEADDSPELYKKKAMEALSRMDEGYSLLLDNYSAQGYRTSELRNVYKGSKTSQSLSSIPDGAKGTYQGKQVVRQGGKWVMA